jgi:hypothetical protein
MTPAVEDTDTDATAVVDLRMGSFVLYEVSEGTGDDRYILSHRCEGTEVRAEKIWGGGNKNYSTWCNGNNELVIVLPDKTETIVTTIAADSPKNAVSLSDVSYVRGSSTVLFSFLHEDCMFEEETCGVGLSDSTVSYAFQISGSNGAQIVVRPIKHFPVYGTPIWNDAGTKALFPFTQVGGAGCDDGPIDGYDLVTDTSISLTTETACLFEERGQATDVESNPMPEWGPLKWVGNDAFTTVIYQTDGTWKAINGTF